jgi:hypothetical protein
MTTAIERERHRRSCRVRAGIGERLHSRHRNVTVDPVAVERACAGEAIRLTQPEVTQAVERLRRAGLSILQTAIRLRVAPRTVSRHWLKAQRLSTGSTTSDLGYPQPHPLIDVHTNG